jgi:hypothetical protein
MATDRPDGDVAAAWLRQDDDHREVALGDVRRRAKALETKLRLRQRVLWLSIVNNVAICAAIVWFKPEARLYVAVFCLAASLAQIQALILSSRVDAPSDAGLLTSVAFLRASLMREHAFLARLWLWFLLPVGVAELALLAGMWATGTPGAGIVLPLVTGIAALLAFMFVRSRQQARRLRTEIDALGNGRE